MSAYAFLVRGRLLKVVQEVLVCMKSAVVARKRWLSMLTLHGYVRRPRDLTFISRPPGLLPPFLYRASLFQEVHVSNHTVLNVMYRHLHTQFCTILIR